MNNILNLPNNEFFTEVSELIYHEAQDTPSAEREAAYDALVQALGDEKYREVESLIETIAGIREKQAFADGIRAGMKLIISATKGE